MIGTAAAWGIRGVLMWALALIVFLFGAFLAGFCLSQLFPDRRSNQFKMIFNMTEFVVLLIITLAGLELAQNTSYVMGLLDPYKIHAMSYQVALDPSILKAHSPVLRTFTQTPALYGVVRLVALFYSGLGADEAVLGSVFMIVHVLCSFFTYRLARMVSGRVASVAVYALMMLVPSQLCVASVANINYFAATFVTMNLYLFSYSRRMSRMERSSSDIVPVVALAAVGVGFAAFFNPVAFILPVGEILFICFYQVNRKGINPDSKKERLKYSIILMAVSIVVFLLLCLVKSLDLKVSVKEVFLPYFHAFFPEDGIKLELPAIWGSEDYAKDVLYYHSPLQCQIAYGCVLAAAFACVVMNWILKQSDYFVLRLFILASVIQTALSGTSSMDHTECYCLLTVLCGGLFGEVYSALRSKAFKQMQEDRLRKEQEKAIEDAKKREEERIRQEQEEKERLERKKAWEEAKAAADAAAGHDMASSGDAALGDDTSSNTEHRPSVIPALSTPENDRFVGEGTFGTMEVDEDYVRPAYLRRGTSDTQEDVAGAGTDDKEDVKATGDMSGAGTMFGSVPVSETISGSESVAETEPVTESEPMVLTVDDVIAKAHENSGSDPAADISGFSNDIQDRTGVSAAASFAYGDSTHIENTARPSASYDDYPEDDGGVITVDDVLVTSSESSDEESGMSDGSDGSMLSNPLEIKERKKDGVVDFDYKINDEEDFDL